MRAEADENLQHKFVYEVDANGGPNICEDEEQLFRAILPGAPFKTSQFWEVIFFARWINNSTYISIYDL